MNGQTKNINIPKIQITRIVTYYLLACTFSWPFFWWRDIHPESWKALALPHFVKNWMIMWGPGLSALICFLIYKKSHVRFITLTGTSLIKSLLFYFLPILALVIVGMKGIGDNEHLMPLGLGIIGFISILGEELGWRGYLQDAFRPMGKIKKYVIIGVMWEIWHFTTRYSYDNSSNVVLRALIFGCITILLSFIIGEATDKSKSVIVAVTFHSWINILAEFMMPQTIIVFCASLPFWIYMLWSWDKKQLIKQV